MNELKARYKDRGLNDFRINTIEDIFHLYNIDILKVDGYDLLTEEHKQLYKKFIINFFNGWGLEARETLKPISFNYVEEVEHVGKEDPEDGYVITLLKEISLIKYDGSMEVLTRQENKDNKLKVLEVYKNKYLRFEYELYDRKEWLHIVNEEEWY